MEKLLAIAGLGQKVYGRWLFQHLLSGIIVVVGLTIVTAIMVSATLIGSLIAAYYMLLQHGTEPYLAMIIIGVSGVLTIVILVLLTLASLYHLRQMPRTLLEKSPLTSGVMATLNAFTDGLMAD